MPVETQKHDSPLGRWRTAFWWPGAGDPLAGLVEQVWAFEGRLTHARERIFPRGRLELVVQIEGRYGGVVGEGRELFPAVCLTGHLLRSAVIEAPPARVSVVGIRLHPAGAFALLGRPLHELTDRTVGLEDVVSRAGESLAEACHQAADPEARVRAGAAWCQRRMTTANPAEPAIVWVSRELDRRAGQGSIQHLRDTVGWSRTRFQEAFRQQIGVTPKVYARLVRFHHALARLHAGREPLADLAHGAGYYDQPHFNAEFREITGLTPTEYLAARRYPESVSVAESP